MARANPDAPVVNPNPTPNPNPTTPTQSGPATTGPTPSGPAYAQGNGGNYTPPPNPGNPSDSPALARIRDLLDSYGLGSLVDWAWQQLVDGRSEIQITQDLRNQDAYRQRFRGLIMRQQAGLNPMSEAEYVAYERQAAAMMRTYGMPTGFYDSTDDFAELIGKDVSVNELEQRLSTYAEAANQAPPEVRDQLRNLYGVDDQHIAAWFADPDRGLQVIQRQYRAAQVAAGAQRQQFGQITAEEADLLAQQGVDLAQANKAFGILAQSREITGALAGEDPASGMARADQLGAVAGDAQAQAELEARRRRRQAAFEGGGSFANSASGLAVGSNLAGS